MKVLSLVLLAALAAPAAFAENYTVQLESSALTAAHVGVTYGATKNLWYIGCQNHDPFFAGGKYATKSGSYEFVKDGEAMVATIPSEIGGFCGFVLNGAPNAGINFTLNGLHATSQVQVLPGPVEGVTQDSSVPIVCHEGGDEIAGHFYDCEHRPYYFENGAVSLRFEVR